MKKKDVTICREAQIFLDDLISLLKKQEITTSLDYATLRLLGNCYHTYITATNVLLQDGYFITSPRGELKSHPAVKIQENSLIQLNRMMSQFGLNPYSRKEISKPKERAKTESDISKFLKKTKKVNVEVQNNY